MTYITPDTKNFYLSREGMIQLGIIDSDFPKLGCSSHDTSQVCQNDSELAEDKTPYADCGCLRRRPPPDKPAKLPFECSIDNVDKMKAWLLTQYASSTFNKCPHQELPEMEGPPISIHVDPKATPISLKKPAPVSLHFQDQVLSDLNRDVTIGVLERVPLGEPTTWIFRMVVTRKADGSPRRTVDLSPMNKHCVREVHTSKSPFSMARSVPDNSFKTVYDCWNGFHSVPIREEDRHLTTFTTPWGLFRYKRAPQGFLSSGDGYNRRFDDLTAHIPRTERCVDDTLQHDVDLEEHWWRVIEYVDLCGRSGIVLNPEKFQFSQPAVNFAGFKITKDSVEPLPKYLDAIAGFPTPKSTTDIRSWFGLINQVSHYGQLRDMMAPFRKFLSPKEKFVWTEELDSAFESSKSQILDAIREGVKIFDVNRSTCLRTDWSKKGIGFLLAQKHCECGPDDSFGCCQDGWKITLAGSRFLSSAEKNYAPVEGEALAVAWALEQTRYFTMGCNKLKIIVDHKPLTKLFGDRRLDEIDNPRLFRLKRRTLMWRFQIEYRRGVTNPFADAMSRHPNVYAELASLSLMSHEDTEEANYVSQVAEESRQVFAVTWEKVKEVSARDESMTLLANYVANGFPKAKSDLPDSVSDFWEIREDLRYVDGVLVYKDRIVIPYLLRKQIVDNLHSAHQGTTSMYSRAKAIVYWPRLISDLENARNNCRSCHKNAPSHAKLPPSAPEIPTTPFQMIFADYFQLAGKHYLVIGDRLSGWTEIVQVRNVLGSTGSKGLCTALRTLFSRVGVPEEISSDGGPEFVSREMLDFFSRWGIRHRLSSAYFPQSNGRAEVAVKSSKRLLEDNITTNGSLDTDEMVRALLQQRNTPDRDCSLSPAEILFGRGLRDTLPQLSKSVSIHDNKQLHSQWHRAWAAKEEALRTRLVRSCEKLEVGSKELPALREGDSVFIQNQDKSSGRPLKWDRQGTVIACKQHDQYLVKVQGSGKLTLRNRRFLRKFQIRSPVVQNLGPDAVKDGFPTVQNPVVKESAQPQKKISVQQPSSIPLDTQTQLLDTQPNVPKPSAEIEHDKLEQQGFGGDGLQSSEQSPEFYEQPVPRNEVMQPKSRPRGRPPKSHGVKECNLPVQSEPSRRSTRVQNQRKLYDASSGQYVDPTE